MMASTRPRANDGDDDGDDDDVDDEHDHDDHDGRWSDRLRFGCFRDFGGCDVPL